MRPANDIEAMACTMFGEARGEPLSGKIGVANVIMNRVNQGGWWGSTITAVCLFPSQFSCWNKDDPNFAKIKDVPYTDHVFGICMTVAEIAYLGGLADITGGSTHYHDESIEFPAAWGDKKTPAKIIGRLHFYNDVK